MCSTYITCIVITYLIIDGNIPVKCLICLRGKLTILVKKCSLQAERFLTPKMNYSGLQKSLDHEM